MTLIRFRASFLLQFILLVSALHQCRALVYTDQFVIHVKGGRAVAEELAKKHGYTYLGEILDGYHHLKHHKINKRSADPSEHEAVKLSEEPEVTWFSQQILKKRVKREHRRIIRIPEVTFSDPLWPKMWYLNRGKELDMNIESVWKQGVSGKGVVVTILDDGLEKDHPDIAQNYDPKASFDVNNHDDNPEPRYDAIDSNRHGTRCAGEVAAIANNSFCAVGVAFEASVGGVRMLDGDVTDAVEAQSLSLNPNHIDIYSASWGPDDDGKTVDGPGELATKAFKEGVETGRNGLGSIFVWASGNGGREHDNCNCDGYTNSIWTLSISSATENGLVPWYSEACSSTLATTYSSGSSGERQIVTTDLHHKCTLAHTGTSASAPLAAGICALALQTNKNLTWRDMQHIVVRTARPDNLQAKDWKINGVGRNVSHSFGYGLMDAAAMVNLARNWVTVPPQKVCDVRAESSDKVIPAKSHVTLSLTVHCEHVLFLEHVQSKITLSTVKRGDVHIYLTSPMGTRSKLLAIRPMDSSRGGFIAWPFMSVHSWGENPNGVWHLEVHNEARYYAYNHPPISILGRAYLKEWSLIMYGTSENPDRHSSSTSSVPPTTITTSTPVATQNIPKIPPPQTKFHYSPPPPPTRNPFPKFRRPPPIGYNSNNNDALKNNEEPSDMPSEEDNKLDCPAGYHLLEGLCLSECPNGYYQVVSHPVLQVFKRETHVHHPKDPYPNVVETNVTLNSVSVCRACHYSCQSCRGPNDDDCLSCYLDSDLDKGYCYSAIVLGKLREAESRSRNLGLVAKIVCPLAILLALYVVYTCCKRRKNSEDKYERATYRNVRSKDVPNGTNGIGHRALLRGEEIGIPDSDEDF